MPRVTFATYAERRSKLNQAWRRNRGDFVDLSPKVQWILHEYYRFTESLTSDELRRHWTGQNAKSSSIAQRAGRAYAVFDSNTVTGVPVTPLVQSREGRRHKLGKVKVGSIVRPQPDTKRLARTLLEIVQSNVRRQE